MVDRRRGGDERVFDRRVESPADGVNRSRAGARTIGACGERRSGRPRPRRLDRLPEQYFAALLGRIAAAAAEGGPPRRRPRPRQPRGRPAAARRRGAQARRPRARRPRLRAVPRPAARCARRSRTATATDYGVELDPDREVAIVPGTKTAILELALVLGRARATDPAPRPVLPRLPLRDRARGRRARARPARPGGGLAARPRRRPARGGALPQLPLEPLRRLRRPRHLRGGGRLRARAPAPRSSTTPPTSTSSSTGGGPRASSPRPGAKDVGVELWSMSKTYGMAGWRIGFVLGNAEIVERINLIERPRARRDLRAAPARRDRRARGPAGQRRGAARRPTSAGATSSPRRCRSRRSARARSTSGSGCPRGLTPERLLEEHRVAIAPGEGFGPSGAGWARLSLAVTDEALERGLERLAPVLAAIARVKIGIVVPFSWSYWGGVVEHAENQAAALRDRGHDVQILMGHDPPGHFTRLLHPRTGRHGDLPPGIIPVGRSVVVPAERLAAEHRALAALDPARPRDARASSGSTSSTSTSR